MLDILNTETQRNIELENIEPENVISTLLHLEALWSEKGGFRHIACKNINTKDINAPCSEATILALKTAEISSDLPELMTRDRLQKMTRDRLQKMKDYFLKTKEDIGFNYIPSDVIAEYEPYIVVSPTLESTRQVMQILKFTE
ncbi:hypothetical protein M1N12_02485 [Peptococcaceae bacterium]|nr:hypothetical protein [Peptococcaceae bacterium]